MEQLDIYTDYYLIKRHLDETSEARKIIDSANSVPLHSLVGIQNLLEKLPRHEILRPVELEQFSNFIKDTAKLKRFMLKQSVILALVYLILRRLQRLQKSMTFL